MALDLGGPGVVWGADMAELLASLKRELLDPEQCALVDIMCRAVCKTGKWLTDEELDGEMERSGYSRDSALYSLGAYGSRRELVLRRVIGTPMTWQLTLDGFALANGGEALVRKYLDAVAYFAERERVQTRIHRIDGPCVINAQDLEQHWNATKQHAGAFDAWIIFDLISSEGRIWSSASPGERTQPAAWQLTLNKPEIRKYRDMESWDEYRERRDEPLRQVTPYCTFVQSDVSNAKWWSRFARNVGFGWQRVVEFSGGLVKVAGAIGVLIAAGAVVWAVIKEHSWLMPLMVYCRWRFGGGNGRDLCDEAFANQGPEGLTRSSPFLSLSLGTS